MGGTSFDWDAIEAEVAPRLAPLGLSIEHERVERHAEAVRSGRANPAANRIRGLVEPARESDVEALETLSQDERARLREEGARAIAAGEIACCVLNGGMATRFGGKVKGVVEAIGGRSFLEIKRAQARARGPIPFLVMNSFATHAATTGFLEERGMLDETTSFLQDVSLRLRPDGSVFRETDGTVSLYAPGHGDLPEALRRSGELAALESRGVRALLLSNVDNLGAEPDPLVIGYHLDRDRSLTCELAAALETDVGGAPAHADGRLQVVEGFRFPEGFDFRRNRWLATNSYLFSLDALRTPRTLTRFYVAKQVDGATAVQLEHLVNELTAWEPTSYLVTPRNGAEGRFRPVKTPEDLEVLGRDPDVAAQVAALF